MNVILEVSNILSMQYHFHGRTSVLKGTHIPISEMKERVAQVDVNGSDHLSLPYSISHRKERIAKCPPLENDNESNGCPITPP